jgi:hypothetical protein
LKHQYNTVSLLLRLNLILLASGIFWQLYTGGSVSSMLFMNFGITEIVSLTIEKIFVVVLLILAIYSAVNPNVYTLYILFVCLVFNVISHHIVGGKHFSDLTFIAHFSRLAVPVSLVLLIKNKYTDFVMVLKLGLSVTFLTHAWEAWQANPLFLDYLIGFSRMSLNEKNATFILKIIGVIDLLSAILCWYNKFKIILFWMVFWGFITAFIRVYDSGWENLAEFLVRTPNFILGIVLIMSLSKRNKLIAF